jgi:alkanesulfonate monooxygenase SsuD/methylene tetrahydromethanopterin reductase-like flavin-dependent oxidoreductase (luciferase family)
MKFGVLQFFSWPGRRIPLPEVYRRALERIEIMDHSGYDCVWLAEHHFTTYSVCPSIHLMAMHVADRTRNLRIGTGVSLAALYHPLRLAEEVALLDVLSGGRVNWGAGRGFDPGEFASFGIPEAESQARFREAVEIVLAAWRDDRLNWSGRHWQFRDVEVLPKPLQRPHPPVWVAASSPPAIEWAASQGHSILLDPHCDRADLGLKRRLYLDGLARAGHGAQGRELPMARLVAVAKTAAEARRVAEQGAAWTVSAYANKDNAGRSIEAGRLSVAPEEQSPVVRYVDRVMLQGTPEQVVDQIQALREQVGLDYLLCAPVSHESFLLLTEQVLPRFL